MLSNILLTMFFCLTMTIIIECGVALILKIKKSDLLIVLLTNVMTNPLLVSISYCLQILYGSKTKTIFEYIMEVLVVIVEGFVYKYALENKKINPFILSLILNLVSYLSGLLLWFCLGY